MHQELRGAGEWAPWEQPELQDGEAQVQQELQDGEPWEEPGAEVSEEEEEYS